jgi:hypothetical protein
MLIVSPEFLAALPSSQQVSVRADLLRAGVVAYSGLPIVGGDVTLARAAITSRTLSCTIEPELPLEAYRVESVLTGGTVGVYGHEVRVYWTLHYAGGGQESVPLGRFRIDSMNGSLTDDQAVQVSGVSREAFVADAGFVAPRTISGPSAQSLIVVLIREVLGSAEVIVSATRDTAVPATPVAGDRWAVIKTLADSIAATVRCDAYGRFIVADAPTVDSAPVATLRAGPGGVLVRATHTIDRSRVRNAWIIQGTTPTTGDVPIQAVVYDDNPTSLTRWGDPDTGAFGMVPESAQVPNLTTLDQCRAVGAAKLAQTCGAARALDLTTVPNPTLDSGDVVDVMMDPADPYHSTRRHIIDGGRIDLIPGNTFSLASRDIRQASDG